MIRKQKEGIHWLQFELFAEFPQLVHAIFLRHGGVSKGPFTSLNFQGKDIPYHLNENKLRIKKMLSLDHLVSAYQIHATRIAHVKQPLEQLARCDGLMTSRPDYGLMIRHADCQAAIFFDPMRKVIANVHCGWRGNVKNIYLMTVLKLQKLFRARPENILVGISPSLGPEKAEFIHYQREFPESFFSYQVKPYYFDLWAIARMQLEQAGILPHHIQIASICTHSHPEDFFSYRRDRDMGICGNNATVVALK